MISRSSHSTTVVMSWSISVAQITTLPNGCWVSHSFYYDRADVIYSSILRVDSLRPFCFCLSSWRTIINSVWVCTNANLTYDAAHICWHELDEMGCEFVMPGWFILRRISCYLLFYILMGHCKCQAKLTATQTLGQTLIPEHWVATIHLSLAAYELTYSVPFESRISNQTMEYGPTLPCPKTQFARFWTIGWSPQVWDSIVRIRVLCCLTWFTWSWYPDPVNCSLLSWWLNRQQLQSRGYHSPNQCKVTHAVSGPSQLDHKDNEQELSVWKKKTQQSWSNDDPTE